MPLPVPVPPARRARPLVATSLGEGVASGHIRQRNLGYGCQSLSAFCNLIQCGFTACLWSILPPSTAVWGSRADMKALFGPLPSLPPCYCPSIPGHPQASTFPELSIYLLFSLCSRSNCHHIKKNMTGQSSCLNR